MRCDAKLVRIDFTSPQSARGALEAAMQDIADWLKGLGFEQYARLSVPKT
jgi:hypothetical protein